MHGLCIVKLFQNSVYTDNNNNKLLLEGKAKLKSHTSTVAIYISCQNLNLIPLLWQYILSKTAFSDEICCSNNVKIMQMITAKKQKQLT